MEPSTYSAGRRRYWLLAVLIASSQATVHDFVNPLIGTANGGHVFAGATLPYSMAKAVADSTEDQHGGFASNGSPIHGFSHMHDSGTGGALSLGNFPIFPHVGCTDNNISNCKFTKEQRKTGYKPKSVVASPGYFSITLDTGVKAEMTVREHVALYRFTFPFDSESKKLKPVINMDAGDMAGTGSGTEIEVDQDSGRIAASATFRPSFGVGSYKSMVCIDFKGAKVADANVYEDTAGDGAWVQFEQPKRRHQLLVRVGLSLISTQQACGNAEREARFFDFDSVHAEAKDAWAMKLGAVKLKTEGVSKDLQTIFWSGIYRTMISPQDYTGENPLWKSKEPYYDSYYCIWDSFRTIHPLITLIDPDTQARMLRSMIDIYRHEGFLPDCRMSLCKGFTQGGSNADALLADSFLKGIRHPKLNWTVGFEAALADAEKESEDWNVEGRGGLESWQSLGYIPADDNHKGRGLHTRSVSRTVEYAYDDFAIATLAERFGNASQVRKYRQRSKNWQNLYKDDEESMGFTGFLQPRMQDGQWGHQDPTLCSSLNSFDSCYLDAGGHETYEGSPWLYSFYVPHDMASLIRRMGGREAFVKRLDHLHESGVLYMGDEQAFLDIFLYHYAGRPGLSAKRAHYYVPSQWNNTVNGIPGNDDAGAMGSALAFIMMGFFPNAGQDVYLITPPFFPTVKLTNPKTEKTATIRNKNFDPFYKDIYIQSATLNGKPYTKNWLSHSFFENGDTLELVLGPEESNWGTKRKDVPPSMARPSFKPYVDAPKTSSLYSEMKSLGGEYINLLVVAQIGFLASIIYCIYRRRNSYRYSKLATHERTA